MSSCSCRLIKGESRAHDQKSKDIFGFVESSFYLMRTLLPRMLAIVRLERKRLQLLLRSITGFRSHNIRFSTSYSPNDDTSCEEAVNLDGSECLSFRVEKLSREESVISVFQKWMGDGLAVHKGQIFHTINRLRKLKKYKRALEVMEWVIKERPYKLTELDYSYLVEFTSKFHGIRKGEKLFTHIPSEFQNELLYNNLVLACLEKGLISLSLAYMKKMRELGYKISPFVYNHLILLHSSPGRRTYIPKFLTQMKADNVVPHPSTFNILLKIKAKDHNIHGLSKVFDKMKESNVEPNEITYCILAMAHAVARLFTETEAYVIEIERSKTGKNWSTLEILLILYGYLCKEEELNRTWKLIQGLPRVRCKSFVIAIEAFGRTGLLNKAEELWKEMKDRKQLKSIDQFNSIISVNCRHGLINRCSELFNEMDKMGFKPNAITYRHLALGCLKSGLVEESLKTLEMGKEQSVSISVRRSIPWLETTLAIVELFACIGDVYNAKKLFEELKESQYTRYTFVHNTLLNAYVNAKVNDPEFLRNMILQGARPDSETYSLLRLVEQFPII